MKKINLMLIATIFIVGFTACKNANKEASQQDVVNVNMYVDSLEKLTPTYTVGYWNPLDSIYQARAMQAEMSLANLDAADKEKYEASKVKYAKMKADYEAKLVAEQTSSNNKLQETQIALADEKSKDKMSTNTTVVVAAPDYKQVLRNALFGEGKIGTDMKFDYANAQNILGIYKNFVNTVADNKKNYTREDWDEIKVLYEALDNKKNSIEKNLASADNNEIAGLKIRFASIKGIYRISAKSVENTDSKK
jgi:hypothetical protein